MTLRLFFPVIAFVLSVQSASAQTLDDVNDAVAFLAGMELPHRADHPLALTATWKNHAEQMDREFASHQERALFPMSKWSGEELVPPAGGESGSPLVRYMFSGPDILHAYYMFPQAETYILCGLEPVGELPGISELNTGNAGRALGEVRTALGEVINFSFFRTADMKDDLKFAVFRGTTPILSIFLARAGQYIKGIEFLVLNADGTLTGQGMKSAGANTVKIEFSPRRVGKTKTLYYFSSNLYDNEFEKSGFRKWLNKQPTGYAYLKAASFLMHGSGFRNIREHLLDRSFQIVQDDSGIPYRYFDGTIWYADLWGNYTGPIDLFSQFYQPDLRASYRARSMDLPFGTGYKWRKNESNLMRFLKQSYQASGAEEKKPAGDVVSDKEEATAPSEDL